MMATVRSLLIAAFCLAGILPAMAEENCHPRAPLIEAVTKHENYADHAVLNPVQLKAALQQIEEMTEIVVDDADYGIVIQRRDGFIVFAVGHDDLLCRTFLVSPSGRHEFLTAVFGRAA